MRILFNHAVENEYLQVTPMKGKLSKASKLKQPAILREDQWRQLLLTAIQTDKDLDQSKTKQEVWVFKLCTVIVNKLHDCHSVNKELVQI